MARLQPPENANIEELARRIGVQPETLERWRDEVAAGVGEAVEWTAAARLDAVLVTAAMDEAAKSAWCRTNGVHVQELVDWRQAALTALGDPKATTASRPPSQSKEDRRRTQELERDLKRKNAALVETTALLVLSKEMAALVRKGEDE